MTDNELLPCPFCGNEALKMTSSDGFTSIGCLRCNPLFGVMIQAETEAEAVAAWNTRTATTDDDFARAVHDGNLWRRIRGHRQCGRCNLNIESVIPLDGCNEHAISYCPNCGAKVER